MRLVAGASPPGTEGTATQGAARYRGGQAGGSSSGPPLPNPSSAPSFTDRGPASRATRRTDRRRSHGHRPPPHRRLRLRQTRRLASTPTSSARPSNASSPNSTCPASAYTTCATPTPRFCCNKASTPKSSANASATPASHSLWTSTNTSYQACKPKPPPPSEPPPSATPEIPSQPDSLMFAALRASTHVPLVPADLQQPAQFALSTVSRSCPVRDSRPARSWLTELRGCGQVFCAWVSWSVVSRLCRRWIG